MPLIRANNDQIDDLSDTGKHHMQPSPWTNQAGRTCRGLFTSKTSGSVENRKGKKTFRSWEFSGLAKIEFKTVEKHA